MAAALRREPALTDRLPDRTGSHAPDRCGLSHGDHRRRCWQVDRHRPAGSSGGGTIGAGDSQGQDTAQVGKVTGRSSPVAGNGLTGHQLQPNSAQAGTVRGQHHVTIGAD